MCFNVLWNLDLHFFSEEELKRLHKALDPQNSYGQVPFSYDNEAEQDESTSSSNKEPNEDAAEEEDEPFIPPQELDIPVGMVLVRALYFQIVKN